MILCIQSVHQYIVHLKHINHIFQELPLQFTKEVQESHKQLCHTKKGGETHLLVLPPTLIYEKDSPGTGLWMNQGFTHGHMGFVWTFGL